MRLIDADELIENIQNQEDAEYAKYTTYGVIREIEDSETIDAEPIIYCKNCKWFIYNSECMTTGIEVKPESFCSFAIMKETENE